MLKEMLSRGIGVHHGGLLPILKVGERRPSRCPTLRLLRQIRLRTKWSVAGGNAPRTQSRVRL